MIDIPNYPKKKKELQFYINELKYLDQVSNSPVNPYERYLNQKLRTKSYTMQDFIVILKSNAYIMMYNMIESTIKEIIFALYDNINAANLTYREISLKLQELWESHQFENLDKGNAKANKYKQEAHKMITSIIKNNTVKFNNNNIKLSGNADFENVLIIMQKHGIKVDTSHIGKYSDELRNIKNIRNSLAHGGTSFIESGRDISFNDINKMCMHTEEYLEQLIKDANYFIWRKQFKNKG